MRCTRRLARLVSLAAAVAALAACPREPTLADAEATGRVEAVRVSGGVELSNGTGWAIAYVAYDPSWLGLLAACADPGPSCLRLPPRRRVVVPESEFAGWHDQPAGLRKLNVRWWRVAASPQGGYVPIDVHEIRVIE